MRFSSLIINNVLHRPVRTILTTLGLAIAIAAIATKLVTITAATSAASTMSTPHQ